MLSLKITSAIYATLIFFTLPACSNMAERAQQNVVPVAKVNGHIITKPQLDRAVKAFLTQNQVTQTLPPEQMLKATDEALNQLTSAELLYQAASKLDIRDLDKQVSKKYTENKAKFPSEAEYEEALKGLQMTRKEVLESMRKEIVVNNFVEKVFVPKATVSELEAKKFYNANREEYFKKGERLRASQILVSVDQKAPASEKVKAKSKAFALLKRVHGGEDFAAVAKIESSGPSSAHGGDLGIFSKGQMTPPFEKAAFALKPGEVSGIVETDFGYHIIKLTERLPSTTEKFADVNGRISAFLIKFKVRQAVTAFILELRSKAHIEKG